MTDEEATYWWARIALDSFRRAKPTERHFHDRGP